MPGPKSPTTTVRVADNKRRQHRRFELTATQVRGLETVLEDGRLSNAIPFHTARSMTNKGLLVQRGPDWFITPLGKQVRRNLRAKQAQQ